MPIPWTVKRQITIFFVFGAIVVFAVVLVIILVSKPTCFDNKQNQNELGIDCGGSCKPCLGEVKNLIVVWSKAFKLENGKYDAAAIVKNPNLFVGIHALKYKFKLYDSDNVLVAVRDGETFINPGEDYVIFQANIDVGERIPVRAFVEFEKNPKWERIEKEKPQIVVSKKDFTNEPFPRLIIEISNKSFDPVKNLSIAAVLFDEEGNAIGASATSVESVNGNSSRQTALTWPVPFSRPPASTKIFLRTNLTHDN